MRILKINKGFVTNSSSFNADILIALRKGVSLSKKFIELGLDPRFVRGFTKDSNEVNEILYGQFLGEEVEEFNKLKDEYNFLTKNFDIDDPELKEMVPKLRNYKDEELICIYFH